MKINEKCEFFLLKFKGRKTQLGLQKRIERKSGLGLTRDELREKCMGKG